MEPRTEIDEYYETPQYIHIITDDMKNEDKWVLEEGQDWFDECIDSGDLIKLMYEPISQEWVEVL